MHIKVTSTKAAVLYSATEPLLVEELIIPPLQEGQVLVQVHYAGICSTQLMEIEGRKGPDPWLPHLLGHEGAGVVIDIGRGVRYVKPGDHVVVSWIRGPGMNAPGPKYQNKNRHLINAGPITTFSEYTIVAENCCTTIPDNFPMDTAALLGCAVLTGAGVVIRQLHVRPGESMVVFGAGGVGLCVILAARLLHSYPVVAVDCTDEKLKLALELGATHLIHAEKEKVVPSIRSIVPEGADHVVDASGSKVAIEQGFQVTRRKGGRCIVAGNLTHGEMICIDPFELIMGKNITGTVGGSSNPEKDIPLYIKLNQSGIFDFHKVKTKVFDLDHIEEAFQAMKNGLPGRLLLKMNKTA